MVFGFGNGELTCGTVQQLRGHYFSLFTIVLGRNIFLQPLQKNFQAQNNLAAPAKTSRTLR